MRTFHWTRWLALATSGAACLWLRADVVQWRPAISARLYHAGKCEALVYQESWFSDQGPNPSFLEISPRFRYHALDHLTLGLNYAFIDVQSPLPDGETEWIDQHRAEFEVNPHWEAANGWKFLLRNRLEVRWIEDQPEENFRSRHLFEVGYPVHFPRPIQGVFSSTEFFYDWSRWRNTENRFSPLGVDLGLSRSVSLRLYYTWREVERPDGWATSHLIWTVFSLKL